MDIKGALKYLSSLEKNNNKEWFKSHNDEYEAFKIFSSDFATKLILGISEFDPRVANLTVKDCTYRIYRDLRFSPNKEPYKTHFGVFVCPNGKKSGQAGYYFHIEPSNSDMPNQNMLYAGLHCAEPDVVKSVREEIYINGDNFDKNIKKAKHFILDVSTSLKRVPNGYPSDFKYAEYLKLKDVGLVSDLTQKELFDSSVIDIICKRFRETKDIVESLNMSVDYTKG